MIDTNDKGIKCDACVIFLLSNYPGNSFELGIVTVE